MAYRNNSFEEAQCSIQVWHRDPSRDEVDVVADVGDVLQASGHFPPLDPRA